MRGRSGEERRGEERRGNEGKMSRIEGVDGGERGMTGEERDEEGNKTTKE